MLYARCKILSLRLALIDDLYFFGQLYRFTKITQFNVQTPVHNFQEKLSSSSYLLGHSVSNHINTGFTPLSLERLCVMGTQ